MLLGAQFDTEQEDAVPSVNHIEVPLYIAEATLPKYSAIWGPAVQAEVKGFVDKRCFEAVDKPHCVCLLQSQWIFKAKPNTAGE